MLANRLSDAESADKAHLEQQRQALLARETPQWNGALKRFGARHPFTILPARAKRCEGAGDGAIPCGHAGWI